MKILLLALGFILSACAHHTTATQKFKFTCPDKSIVRTEVTQHELDNQKLLYDRIIELCKK